MPSKNLKPKESSSENGAATLAINSFDDSSFIGICDHLARLDPDLQSVLDNHHYPPIWKRPASFETLVHIILEQQVSLASALAAMNKLREKTGLVTPENLLALTPEELQACYFSRQKIAYTRHLATALVEKQLDIPGLALLEDAAVRAALIKIKGIGPWTADIYLMMVLQRSDVFPLGDVALITSIKETKRLSKDTSNESIAEIASGWKPYQTIAAFILWHSYLCKRRR